MKSLKHNWLTNWNIDLEYKQYILLSYLKQVEKKFFQQKLYPYLKDLKKHYDNLLYIRNKKEDLSKDFPKEITGFDLEEFRIKYQQKDVENELMKEVERIIEFAMPDLKEHIKEGEKIRQHVREHIEVKPVGLLPLRKDEGFLLLSKHGETRIYQYKLKLLHQPGDELGTDRIQTQFLDKIDKGLIKNSYLKLKNDLLKTFDNIPNPATYVVETDLHVPHIETLMPVAKQVLINILTQEDNKD